MKKTLLVCSVIISSCFFSYAQLQVGGVNVNVGQVQGTIGGQQVIVDPNTGQIGIKGANGAVQLNTKNGQFGAAGTIGGVQVQVGQGASLFGLGKGSAFSCQNQGGLLGLLGLAQCVVAKLVPFLVGVALLGFFWYLVTFIWNREESPEGKQKALKGIWYSILALFVMVSIWGIISFAGSTLGIGQGGSMHGFNLPGEQ